jgi:hypothetical protein
MAMRSKVLAEPSETCEWSSVTPTVTQRTAGAMAVIDSLVACMPAEELRHTCDDDHHLGYEAVRRLANVVAGRLVLIRLQLLDMFAHPETPND